MRYLPKNLIFTGLIGLVLCYACNKDRADIIPVAEFRVSPPNGITTDSFSFDASYSDPGRQDDKPYFRWDWNNDGIWDGEYSRISIVHHRFYTPGTHIT